MSDIVEMRGRTIRAGRAAGLALVSSAPIGFLGGVDPETGIVLEAGHPLQGQSIAGKVLVFPTGKGSTVGSYTLLRLQRAGARRSRSSMPRARRLSPSARSSPISRW